MIFVPPHRGHGFTLATSGTNTGDANAGFAMPAPYAGVTGGMGHFSQTCMISRLPITGGTPIRVCLLSASPYGPKGIRFGNDWSFRSIPFRAEYNDYGSIENVPAEDRVLVDLALAQFDRDAVEVPQGKNPYHDPPVTRGMPEEAWWNALTEGRLRVRSDDEVEKLKVPRGVPTWRRAGKILRRAEAAGVIPTGGTAIRVAYGMVKVVFNGNYTKKGEWCEALRPLLERKYRVTERYEYGLKHQQDVISHHEKLAREYVPGTNMQKPELEWARTASVQYELSPKEGPYPPVNPHRAKRDSDLLEGLETGHRRGSPKTVLVAWAFVREDVWQTVVSLGGTTRDYEKEPSVAETKERLRAGIDEVFSMALHLKRIRAGYLLENELHELKTTPPFFQGVADGVADLGGRFRDGSVTPEAYDHALTSLAEFVVVKSIARGVCITTAPTHGGPQDGAWEAQAAFHNALTPVVAKALKDHSYGEETDETA